MRALFPVQTQVFSAPFARARRLRRARITTVTIGLTVTGLVWAQLAFSIGSENLGGRLLGIAMVVFMVPAIGLLIVLLAMTAGSRLAEGGFYTAQIPWRSIFRAGDLGLVRWTEVTSAEKWTFGTMEGVNVRTSDGRLGQFGPWADPDEYATVLRRMVDLRIPVTVNQRPFPAGLLDGPPAREGWGTALALELRLKTLRRARRNMVIGCAAAAGLAALAAGGYGVTGNRGIIVFAGAGSLLALLGTRGWTKMDLRDGPTMDGHHLYGERIPWRAVFGGRNLGELLPSMVQGASIVEGGWRPGARLILWSKRNAKTLATFHRDQEIANVLKWLANHEIPVRRTKVTMEGLWTRVVSDEQAPNGAIADANTSETRKPGKERR